MPTPDTQTESRIWDPTETLPRPDLQALQLTRLRDLRVCPSTFRQEHTHGLLQGGVAQGC